MNVAFLLKNYFNGQDDVSIDVFDSHSLNSVYQDVMKTMTSHMEIETSVLQALSYCFYEMLDNVHIHSGKPLGTAMTRFNASKATLQVLIADDGIGIRQSLAENPKYKNITEADSLSLCLQDSITDGKGMGFGLYATSRLIEKIGIKFVLHSGNHKLIFNDGEIKTTENGLWQGTIIYMEIRTSTDINPNDVVDNRTDAAEEYNETFINSDKLQELWQRNIADAHIFRFADYGTDFGTREMGAKMRNIILQHIHDLPHIILDFVGVNVVSNSFSDECVAKLLLEMPLSKLKESISFHGLNPMAERCILVALQRRLKDINK